MADGVNVMSLQGELTLNDEDFQRGLNNAQQGMQETAEAVEQAGQQIGQTMRGVQSEVERTNESISQSTEQSTRRQFNSYSEYRSAVMSLQWQIQREQNVDQSTAIRLAREQLGEYKKNAREQLEDLENKFKKTFENIGNFAKKTFAALGKVTLAGLGAAATGVGAMIKQATSSYGEYEQLVGGVETLFKDNAEEVVKNSQIAYQSAQMSANEYMNTVTSFSASLLQGLGGDTKKATEIADKAIIDMSDKMLVRLKRVELYQRCGAKRQQEMVA